MIKKLTRNIFLNKCALHLHITYQYNKRTLQAFNLMVKYSIPRYINLIVPSKRIYKIYEELLYGSEYYSLSFCMIAYTQ